MASVFPLSRTQELRGTLLSPVRLARAMTWNCSLAVLVFCLLQLAAVVMLSDWSGGGLLPFLALALLALLFIPYARRQERRWRQLATLALPSDGLLASFRRDRNRLWRLTLLGPLGWVVPFMLLSPITG